MGTKVFSFRLAIFSLALLSWSVATETLAQVRLAPFIGNLTQPVYMVQPPDGTGRFFVVEKGGRIKVYSRNRRLIAPRFLTVPVSTGPEQGLFSLAFHPNYRANHRFYINYTDVNGDSNVVEYKTLSRRRNVVAPGSRRIILKVDQPFANHNGGMLLFGPDGNLYIGFGDGGSQGDPLNNAQRLSTLLGKMLRIRVGGRARYTVPLDNPFIGIAGARREIWAYGFRNPWRYSFDAAGRLFVGDVGQQDFEEVDLVQKGGNYGWGIMEGSSCASGRSCNQTGLTLPVLEYSHTEGRCVTAGYVYRGRQVPSLAGKYVLGDCVNGRLWIAEERPGGSFVKTLALTAESPISSFAEDLNNELYVVTLGGKIFRIGGG